MSQVSHGRHLPSHARRPALRTVTVLVAVLAATVWSGATGPLDSAQIAASQRRRDPELAVGQLEGRGATAGRPAVELSQSVLMAGPDELPQQVPPPLQPLAVTQLDERERGADLDAGPRLSLRIAEPMPMVDLLLLLVRDTGFSVVPDPVIGGTFTGDLKSATLRQALDQILPSVDLDYSVDGRFIRVFRRRVETRFFDLNYVSTRRTVDHLLAATTGFGQPLGSLEPSDEAGAPGQPRPIGSPASTAGGSSTSARSVDADDVFDDLARGVHALLSDEGRFNLDRKAGLLQVTDLPDQLERVREYLEAVEVRVQRQVQIHAQVIEVELTGEFAADINWQSVLRDAAGSVVVTRPFEPETVGTVTLGIELRDVAGFLEALGRQGRVNVLSSPRVVAMHNEPIVIRVGIQDVVFTTIDETDVASGQTRRTRVEPQAITEGVVLRVTAHISAEGSVSMSISPSVTERAGEARSRLGDAVPILSIRETDTLVRVRDGETVLITGLMLDRMQVDSSRVPVLGAVPWIGGLFSREQEISRKTDLVILLTPTLLPSDEAAADTTETGHLVSGRDVAGGRPCSGRLDADEPAA